MKLIPYQKYIPALCRALSLIVVFAVPLSHSQEQQSTENSQEVKTVDVNQVKFITDQGFMLAGKYYSGTEDHAGVLLLHGCDNTSDSYTKLAELLSGHGLHALALDLRGYGDSVSEQFSHNNIKRNSKDINSYQTEVARLSSYWKSDVLAAYKYLRSRISNQQDVAVVSAGCSAAQAIYLAETIRIKSFVMITPILNYMEKEHYKNLIDIPIYFVASAHHTDTYQTTKELFEWNGESRSVFQLFKGIRQGHSLLNSKAFLANNIAVWLEEILDDKSIK